MLLSFPLIWAAGTIAGLIYAHERGIPWMVALSALPAFLLEASFYNVLGSERLRSRIEKLHPSVIASVLTIAAVIPYCAAALVFRNFDWHSALWIAGLAALASFWYVLLPRSPSVDILFLAMMAAVWLSRILQNQYIDPHPRLPLSVLGQLMWFRTGLLAIISVGRARDVGFGFWPAAREWLIGVFYFVLLLPVVGAAAWFIEFARPHLRYNGWAQITLLTIATFFAALWVLALGEEFFFRGLLQQWMTKWLSNEWAGIAVTSVLFGSAHLWYRSFPNWRFAIIAGLAGVFYGLAFRQAKSIRASMVTHALTVTTWRVFFS